jgi:Zn-dependent protease/predicted transcriptional regulator
MRWSVKIGEFKGIQVYIHWTFLLLLFYIGFANYQQSRSTDQLMLSLGYILTLFACVVLHEFGHALTARRFGIKTRDITLFPIGGMARMEKMPDSPKEELLVAIAGPMVNVVIAGALFAYMHFSPTVYEIAMPKGPMTADMFVPMLFLVNVIMAVFNLIPAFPMDGGRVFRALLSMRLERTRATQIAANVGQALAIGFVMLGLFYNIWLVFIGIFIYLGAGAEASQEYVKRNLSAQRVGNLLMTKFTLLKAEDQLSMALRALLDSQEREFLVTEAGEIAGVLTRDAMLAGLNEFGQNVSIGKIMRRDIQFLPPQMPLTEALRILSESNMPLLPVGYPGQLLGVIDLENISEFLLIQKATH